MTVAPGNLVAGDRFSGGSRPGTNGCVRRERIKMPPYANVASSKAVSPPSKMSFTLEGHRRRAQVPRDDRGGRVAIPGART